MSSNIKIIFLILSLSLILSQEVNKTETKKEEVAKEPEEKPKIEQNIDLNSTNQEKPKEANNTNYRKQQQKRDFKSKIPFNMTFDEMDAMMLCTIVVQTTVREKKEEFKALQKKLNLSNIN